MSVGLREKAVAIFRELLADDDGERELLELADPGDPTLAEGQQPGGRQEGVHGRAQEVGRGAAALGSDLDEAIIFAPVEADRAVLVGGRQNRAEERRVGKGGVSTCRSRWSPYH